MDGSDPTAPEAPQGLITVFEVDAEGVLLGLTGPPAPALGLDQTAVGRPLREAHARWRQPRLAACLSTALRTDGQSATIELGDLGQRLSLSATPWRGGAIGLLEVTFDAGPIAAWTDLGRWTRSTIHMLNNSLTAMVGYAQLGRSNPDDEMRDRAFEEAAPATVRLLLHYQFFAMRCSLLFIASAWQGGGDMIEQVTFGGAFCFPFFM